MKGRIWSIPEISFVPAVWRISRKWEKLKSLVAWCVCISWYILLEVTLEGWFFFWNGHNTRNSMLPLDPHSGKWHFVSRAFSSIYNRACVQWPHGGDRDWALRMGSWGPEFAPNSPSSRLRGFSESFWCEFFQTYWGNLTDFYLRG